MRNKHYVDIRGLSFHEFVDFWFGREVLPGENRLDSWRFGTELTFDLQVLNSYFIQLFNQPKILLARLRRSSSYRASM